MPPSIDVLTSSSAPAWPTALMALKSPPVPECHGSEAEFRNQETCIAERCVFHGVFLSCESEVSLGVSEARASRSTSLLTMANRKLADNPHISTPIMLLAAEK